MAPSEYCDTSAFEKIEAMHAHINIIQGGARAGKTVAVLMLLCDLSFEVHDKVIHIVSNSYPNLENGAMLDWKRLLRGTGRERYWRVNQVKHSWENLCTGTQVKFVACDAEDALGAGRDYLFVNEANRIDFETFRQLNIRTTGTIWIDFNPVNEFWAHTEIMAKRNDWEFVKLTYLDNEAIPEGVLAALLESRGDGQNNWWRVYGLGEIGSLEGNIYEGWLPYEELPEKTTLKRYGVDFGFSNDPTAVVAVYEDENNELYIKTEILGTKILTPELIGRCKKLPDALFVCDNARPEIIAEMAANGLRAIGCDKTPGEKMNGKRYNIELVQRRKVHYFSGDKDLEREYLTYAWRKKKTGEVLDEPEDGNDHIMDAVAYAVRDMARKPIEYGGVR